MTYIESPHSADGLGRLRAGYRWNYADCPMVSTDDLMRAPYAPARGLVRMPSRLSAGRPKPPVVKDGIGTIHARSFASKRGQEAYALRCELGDRAYAELTGKRVRRTSAAKPKPKGLDRTVAADVRRRADGGSPVVLSDHEMMKALGIAPIGYLD